MRDAETLICDLAAAVRNVFVCVCGCCCVARCKSECKGCSKVGCGVVVVVGDVVRVGTFLYV